MMDCQDASAVELEEKLKRRGGCRGLTPVETANLIHHRLENKEANWLYITGRHIGSPYLLLPLQNSKGERVLLQLRFKNEDDLSSMHEEVEKSRAIPFNGRQLLVVVVSPKESVPKYLRKQAFNKVVNIPQDKTFNQVFPQAKSAERDSQSVASQQAIDLMVTDLAFLGLTDLQNEVAAK